MAIMGNSVDGEIVAKVRNCHSNLQALQSEYGVSLNRIAGRNSNGANGLQNLLFDARKFQELLTRETRDIQVWEDGVEFVVTCAID